MIGLETAVSIFTAASAVIATLQAGTRATYLLKHNEIDVKEGPLILPPAESEVSPLWDIVNLFQNGVRLGLRLAIEEEDSIVAHKLDTENELLEFDKLNQNVNNYLPTGENKYLKHLVVLKWPVTFIQHGMTRIKNWNFEVDDEMDSSFFVSAQMHINGAEATTAEITAYAPDCFADLRSRFGIAEESYRQSMLESGPFISFQSNSKGAARVGGVFFFTRDGAYMIKTIKPDEVQTFVKMLPKYYKFMKRNAQRSLLTRFCGIYTAKLTKDQQYTFVVMNSVFPGKGSQFISEMFDLKGSTVGRECSEKERREKGSKAVLKDLNLAREVEIVRSSQNNRRRRLSKGYGIHLGAAKKSALLSQLGKDVAFLKECNVMDYSLLVGIVNLERPGSSDKYTKTAKTGGNAAEKIWKTTPIRILMPGFLVSRQLRSLTDRTLSSVLTCTHALPYYGSSACGVNGGELSVLNGRRHGQHVIYYLGLIDFLQPWTSRKVAEKRLKRMLGYDTDKISCVDPDLYASRFLDFVNENVS